MGNFIDKLITRGAHFIKRQDHERQALGWQRVIGKITRFSPASSGSALPTFDYEYVFDGESRTGSGTGRKIRDEDVSSAAKTIDGYPLLHIRVNPTDPTQSRILNRDNPRLPFEIDHLDR